MMESLWLQEIKLWLLDHAAKHGMNDVVKYILEDKSTMEHLCKKFSNSSSQQEVQPTYLFVLLLEHLKESLQNFQPPDSSQSFSWDKEALSLIIDILDVTYREKPIVDFLTFMKLLKLLKILVIFRMIYENVGDHAICGALNLHFPHWSTDSREKLKRMYGDESETYAEDIKETNSDTRKFILMLLINPQRRKLYFERNFDADVKKMVKKTMPLLDVVITAVKKLIGPSTVEQIISCTDENLSSSNDPAVQIILEYLKPDMTAYDFLELLKILEPPDCQEDNINIRFGSPVEELNFVLDCGTLGDSGLKFSVVDDDTPPSSDNLDVVPNTERKQYGPLGLFPPSAKKTAEELSEIQVAQEHMELVMDSEDEEQL